MATEKKAEEKVAAVAVPASAAGPTVILTGRQYAAQQLANEIAANKGKRIDETVAGGKYKGADGKFHDAEGKPIKSKADADEEK